MTTVAPGEVHVWRASLSQPRDVLACLSSTLSTDERDRAERAASRAHRTRFIGSRAIQRAVLSGYTGVSAAELVFGSTPNGKPFLIGPPTGVEFNLSNSGDVMVCAVTRVGSIGVDIEEARTVEDAAAIADRFFTPDVAAALRRTPEPFRSAAFLRCWVGREARIKAAGGTVWDVVSHHAEADGPHWTVHPLDLGADLLGALAVEGTRPITLLYRDWTAEPAD